MESERLLRGVDMRIFLRFIVGGIRLKCVVILYYAAIFLVLIDMLSLKFQTYQAIE